MSTTWSFVTDPRSAFTLGSLLHSCLHSAFYLVLTIMLFLKGWFDQAPLIPHLHLHIALPCSIAGELFEASHA